MSFAGGVSRAILGHVSMRDVLLLAFIAGSLLVTLRYPFIGLLLWAWFTLATPQQAAYGAKDIPLNLIIAAVVFVVFFFHQEFKKLRFDSITVLLICFSLWILVSQNQSLVPDRSMEFTDRFIKVLVFIFLISQVVTTRLRFHALLWAFILIMGFYGAKGGFYTVVKLGSGTYTGQVDTILYDNNHMGIALVASLPMMLYIAGIVKHDLVRYGIYLVIMLSVIAIIGTYSRGALISLVMFGLYLWLRAGWKQKLMLVALMAMVSVPAIQLMPDRWSNRMGTITEADEDASFMGRVDAWVINYKLANKYPLTGTGLRNPYNKDVSRQVEMYRQPRAAHSIYFEVLGGMGYIGLALYLGLIGMAWFKAVSAERKYRHAEVGSWRARFGYFAQISLFVFCAGGASASMEMWEGYLLIIALISVLPFIDHTPERQRRGVALAKIRRRIQGAKQR